MIPKLFFLTIIIIIGVVIVGIVCKVTQGCSNYTAPLVRKKTAKI